MSESEPLTPRQTWEFRHLETGEVRQYEQRELSIDGEVQLFSLAGRAIDRLSEKNFPWHTVRETLQTADKDGLASLDWSAISNLLTMALAELPGLGSEMATILLGIFPVDQRGQRNKEFDDEVTFIRGALKMERLVDMLKVFTEQNEYQRLALPFVNRLRTLIATYAPPPTNSDALPEVASQAA